MSPKPRNGRPKRLRDRGDAARAASRAVGTAAARRFALPACTTRLRGGRSAGGDHRPSRSSHTELAGSGEGKTRGAASAIEPPPCRPARWMRRIRLGGRWRRRRMRCGRRFCKAATCRWRRTNGARPRMSSGGMSGRSSTSCGRRRMGSRGPLPSSRGARRATWRSRGRRCCPQRRTWSDTKAWKVVALRSPGSPRRFLLAMTVVRDDRWRCFG